MGINASVYVPDWAIPPGVGALQTTRLGGVSEGVYQGFNLGTHVGDDPLKVAANRAQLAQMLPGPAIWLEQVHGTVVVDLDELDNQDPQGPPPKADGAVARQPGRVCVIQTADCLPVLCCDRSGQVVGAAHAGWRGLAGGVIEAMVAAMATDPADLCVWLGPAIGPSAFEVGEEVRTAFVDRDARAAAAFRPAPSGSSPGKWWGDLHALARLRLERLGVGSVTAAAEACTVLGRERYFSYRRDGVTGRMASLIWLKPGR